MPEGNPPETARSQCFSRRELPTTIDGPLYLGPCITSSSKLDIWKSVPSLSQFVRSMVHYLSDRCLLYTSDAADE